MNNNTFLCNFNKKIPNLKSSESTIIFTPYLSNIINNNNYNNNSNNIKYSMKINVFKHECDDGYYIKCGIILIPKNNKLFKLNELKYIYEKECNHIKFDNFTTIPKKHNKFNGFNSDSLTILNRWETNGYVSCYRIGDGIDAYSLDAVNKYQIGNINENDDIYVCIDFICNNNEFYLYFTKNNQIFHFHHPFEECPFIDSSKRKFDFNKYDCLFALCGASCDCNSSLDQFRVRGSANDLHLSGYHSTAQG